MATIIMTAEKNVASEVVVDLIEVASFVSTVSISLLNLLSMRPAGVTSYHRIVAWTTVSRSCLKKRREARSAPTYCVEMVRISTTTPAKPIRA